MPRPFNIVIFVGYVLVLVYAVTITEHMDLGAYLVGISGALGYYLQRDMRLRKIFCVIADIAILYYAVAVQQMPVTYAVALGALLAALTVYTFKQDQAKG